MILTSRLQPLLNQDTKNMVLSTAFAAFLIALSCNLDNAGVGISYGTRRIRLPLATNFYIALLTSFGAYLAMVAGQQALPWMH